MKVEIYRFLLATWPQSQSVTWLCRWRLLVLSDRPATFRVHRPYGTGNNGVCNISSNSNSISNSNSNTEVPTPKFTNGLLGWPESTSFLSVNKAFKVGEVSTSQTSGYQANWKRTKMNFSLNISFQRWHKIGFKSFSQTSKNCASFTNTFRSNGIFKQQVY